MCLHLYLHRCSFSWWCWLVFVLHVEGGERERFLQVLLASKTKLRGRGRSLRGEKVDMHNTHNQPHKNLCWSRTVRKQNEQTQRKKKNQRKPHFTCGWSSGGSVGVAATPCPSVSDWASSSSTSWIVGVTSEGGRDVFFFFRFFLRRLSMLCTLLRRRWGRGRWVDRGWWVWWKVCLWSGRKKDECLKRDGRRGTPGNWLCL